MVFFTCSYCGEPIKKPNVAKHYMTKCRGSEPNLTCIDCCKDFRGTEYEAHVKCVTELERYSEVGFVPKPNSNKGEKKQQSWFESVQELLNGNLKRDERELLTLLSQHENLPRKKAKFLNFLTNAHRSYLKRQELVERVWNLIENAGKKAKGTDNTPKETNGVTNGTSNEKANGSDNTDTTDDLKASVMDIIGSKISFYKFNKKIANLAETKNQDLKSIQKKIKFVKDNDSIIIKLDSL